jgi:hypothetical protein
LRKGRRMGDGLFDIASANIDEISDEEKKVIEKEFIDIYVNLILILKKYLDLKEDYYHIVAIWIIGTYMHKNFYTYPYLFFNAMKGSGKSRALKLIAALSYKGEIIASLNDAVLFRAEANTTFCIDEFESVGNKDKQSLRELLNGAYKKGTKIRRVKEVRKVNPETGKSEKNFEVEEFEPFRPIAMANIWGMEEVLNDRCISLILERSNKKEITNKLEIFDLDDEIQLQKVRLIKISVYLCSVYWQKKYIEMLKLWNIYTYIYTIHKDTQFNNIIHKDYLDFFEKIMESGISSRSLELCFPLMVVAEKVKAVEMIISILKGIMESKKEDELFESKDVQLFDFIARKTEFKDDYVSISELVREFRIFLEGEHEEIEWLTPNWMGRALKRLALIRQKRRLGTGKEVMLDIRKAEEKIKIFRPKEDET